jgi:hypothetical protein
MTARAESPIADARTRKRAARHGGRRALTPARARPSTPASAPRAPADVPGFDRANPRASAPASVLAAREVAARETVVAVERAKLLREDVVACYRAEGVNHLERCGARVQGVPRGDRKRRRASNQRGRARPIAGDAIFVTTM